MTRSPRPLAALARLARLGNWLRRADPPPTTLGISRLEVRPPPTWGQADSVWQSVWQWLRDTSDEPLVPVGPLADARLAFCTALRDIPHADATDLMQRAAHARSMRELWYLRPELYGVIARHLSQHAAEQRLAPVNRFFPIGAHAAAPRPEAARHGHDHTA